MGRAGDEWDGSEWSGDEWVGSGHYGGNVSNAIPLLLAYTCIVAVMSVNII